jgi:hypothetical protein
VRNEVTYSPTGSGCPWMVEREMIYRIWHLAVAICRCYRQALPTPCRASVFPWEQERSQLPIPLRDNPLRRQRSRRGAGARAYHHGPAIPGHNRSRAGRHAEWRAAPRTSRPVGALSRTEGSKPGKAPLVLRMVLKAPWLSRRFLALFQREGGSVLLLLPWWKSWSGTISTGASQSSLPAPGPRSPGASSSIFRLCVSFGAGEAPIPVGH